MKNLNLENAKVVELNQDQLASTEGGWLGGAVLVGYFAYGFYKGYKEGKKNKSCR